MIPAAEQDNPVRRKIERLGSSLSMPTVRRALGMLEGEHPSGRPSGDGDVTDIRPYTIEDEARLIDWRASARIGRPVVVSRERMATSRVWMILDVGEEMTGICSNGERAVDVAANALCMVGALSLRRLDDISFVTADSHRIVRTPFHGSLARFESIVDSGVERAGRHPRDARSMLDYLSRIRDRHSLVVVATEEHSITTDHITMLTGIARSHPLILIRVSTVNPLRDHGYRLSDRRGRRIPSFMIGSSVAEHIDARRAYVSAMLDRDMTRVGAVHVRADSSETMFDRFLHEMSRVMTPAQGRQGISEASSWRRA
ncbi:DUF58 domain-containing protein [uncultured Bifidobacterium sp.]|uniref:DUF58 domain-containing protein n=1 Tax=uncultured Bifidobacterium sp. TaxID=165187 RepID=UPI0026267015|nr:DUF58 domain-containing protein [uncultured Bifidobacterium sp.]